jgi:D-alanine-D-alanine ligase
MIAVIQGGPSSEAAVSRVTSKAIQDALTEMNLSFEVFEADHHLVENLKSRKYKCAIIALHGRYGEDGIIQGICEYLKIPYTGSGLLASALCFHKEKTKQQFRILNIPTPEGFLILREKNKKAEEYPRPKNYPAIIKPNQDGSSVGVYICQNESEFLVNLTDALKKFSELIVEQFIIGHDVTVGLLNGEALEPIMIKPKEGFYNYENKYTAGKTEYLIPAPLKPETVKILKSYSEKIFNHFELRAYARVDFMLDKDENMFALEVNTLPGMTPTSLLPKAAKYQGYAFKDIIKLLIDKATLDAG